MGKVETLLEQIPKTFGDKDLTIAFQEGAWNVFYQSIHKTMKFGDIIPSFEVEEKFGSRNKDLTIALQDFIDNRVWED